MFVSLASMSVCDEQPMADASWWCGLLLNVYYEASIHYGTGVWGVWYVLLFIRHAALSTLPS
jgi:hypothetical protein